MAPFFSSDFGGWWVKVSWVPESGQIYWHKFRFLKGYRVHIDAPFFSQPWGDCLCWLHEAFNEIKTQEQELEEAREEVWKEPTYPWRFFLVVPSIFSDLKPPVLQILRIKVVKDKVYHQPYKSDVFLLFTQQFMAGRSTKINGIFSTHIWSRVICYNPSCSFIRPFIGVVTPNQ